MQANVWVWVLCVAAEKKAKNVDCVYTTWNTYTQLERDVNIKFSLYGCVFSSSSSFRQNVSFHNASAVCMCTPFVALLSVRITHSLFIYIHSSGAECLSKRKRAFIYNALVSFFLLPRCCCCYFCFCDTNWEPQNIFCIIVMKNVIGFLYIYIFFFSFDCLFWL